MSHKSRTFSSNDVPPCEKYLNKMLRQEALLSKKNPGRYQEKVSQLSRQHYPQPHIQIHKVRPKSNPVGQRSIPPKEDKKIIIVTDKRTVSRSRSKEKEPWGEILRTHKSTEKVSSFGNFDPLRTMNFLSKELHTRLEKMIPGESDVLQMIVDIQHALKRIPPEVSSLLHNPQVDISHVLGKVNTTNRICQTPPTLYQEDTEKFQKIMEENTTRLEASCQQLEQVCIGLQHEKELTEKELDQAKENMGFLCSRIKELENEIEELSNVKIIELEEENQRLKDQLANTKVADLLIENKRLKETTASVEQMSKLVDELKKQKKASDEECAQLKYEVTLLKMEKEKYATMLSVRDKEVKDIQEEMTKIQDQVYKQLKKLNDEVLHKAKAMKVTDEEPQDNLCLDMGDTTISSITTIDSERATADAGDADALKKKSQTDMLNKLKADNVEIDLPASNKGSDCNQYERFLAELTPSIKDFLQPL